MHRSLLLLTFLLSPFFSRAQGISFYFPGTTMPSPDSTWTDTSIRVSTVVYASAMIDSVTATAGGRQVVLSSQPNSGSTYNGTLSLRGLPGDTLTLVITATDTLGNDGDTAIRFIYRPLNDPAVSLTVDGQADSAAVKAVLSLQARSAGNTIEVYHARSGNNNVLIASAADSLASVDLSAYNGQRITLKVIATDSLGRTAREQLTVFVENSPYLAAYLTTPGIILDFRHNKALVADTGTGYPLIVDAATGQRSAPLVNSPVTAPAEAFVTPEGAMFKAGAYLYEWKDGQVALQALGEDLEVAGQYAAWRNINSLVRRHLATGSMDSATIPDYYGGDLDIGPNGAVVFDVSPARYLQQVYQYNNGQVTLISSGSIDHAPVTDGINTIYYKEDSGGPLYFYNGQFSALLGELGIGIPVPGEDYQLNNRYAAFGRQGQIVVRDTAGNMRQVTDFSYCPTCENRPIIDLLNGQGELMVSQQDSGRYFINSSGQRRRITTMPVKADLYSEVLSCSFYDNGDWYVLIGKTLFKVNLNSSATTVPQPVISGLQSSYCNVADSQRVKIANLPAAASGITVSVTLDSTILLPVAADSTFTLHPDSLSAGRHALDVIFTKDTVEKRLSLSFTIQPAVTPVVDVTVNVNPIINDATPVIITAVNVSGGGKLPLYTFAWDRDFMNQLQVEGSNNTTTQSPAAFKLGENKVYVRMRSSEQCYTTSTAIDSITINKSNITAIEDTDNPGQPVTIYPNPFHGQLSISGLQAVKTYIISLYDIQGRLVLRKRLVNQTKAELTVRVVTGGMYILHLYDEKGKKLLGTQQLAGY
ncbi:T9SS type A sorting domain-containing protein [Chitinophaga japonensis]|uniref:Putative secreted protein (Por secretion system target) n=1 Tax=Chitinophaga japonensis TaxID=104662 RepID=A0A562TB51_CHIJA|nr:T9SS type A sorting domain-containing protein [Chitinophaga japonensis]TWI90792.1 putative secreted protein (Por secretion system target) [Chitinophaga japonensis]